MGVGGGGGWGWVEGRFGKVCCGLCGFGWLRD
jgi:hypothetical protein